MEASHDSSCFEVDGCSQDKCSYGEGQNRESESEGDEGVAQDGKLSSLVPHLPFPAEGTIPAAGIVIVVILVAGQPRR